MSTGSSIQYTTLHYIMYFIRYRRKNKCDNSKQKAFLCVENPKQKQKTNKRFGYFSAIVSWADDNHFQYIEAIERKTILSVSVRASASCVCVFLSLLIIIVAAGSKNTRQYKCHSDRGKGRGRKPTIKFEPEICVLELKINTFEITIHTPLPHAPRYK